MKYFKILLIVVIAGMSLVCMGACDSDSNGGGGTTTAGTATGYKISDFAGAWKITIMLPGPGVAQYKIELDSNGSIVGFARLTAFGFPIDQMIGAFLVNAAKLTARDVVMRSVAWPRGATTLAGSNWILSQPHC